MTTHLKSASLKQLPRQNTANPHISNTHFKLRNLKQPLPNTTNINESHIEIDSNSREDILITLNLNKWNFLRKNQSVDKNEKQKLIQKLIKGETNNINENINANGPNVDMKILGWIDNYDRENEDQLTGDKINSIVSSRTSRNSKREQVIQTQEYLKAETNKKVIQDIIFNKAKQSLDENPVFESNILTSFKNLLCYFKHPNKVINYELLKFKISEIKSQNTLSMNIRSIDKDQKRQQENFDQICKQIEDNIEDIEKQVGNKKIIIEQLRIYSHDSLEGNSNRKLCIDQQIEKTISHTLKNLLEEDENNLLNRKTRLKRIIDEINYENQQIKILKINQQQIVILFIDFLNMVLHSSEILIIKSLSLVVNKLFKLGATENIIEFPLYLDEAAKQFLINKANLESKLENVKTSNKLSPRVQNVKFTNTENEKQGELQKFLYSNGQNGVFESKQQLMKQNLQNLKGHSKQISKPLPSSDHLMLKKRQSLSLFPQSQISQIQENRISVQGKQENILGELSQICNDEINRIKKLCQNKQNDSIAICKIRKIIQAEFGGKKVQQILNDLMKHSSQMNNDQKNNDNHNNIISDTWRIKSLYFQ